MLTHDFSEIISVVLEKSRHNALETFSSDEVRSISLILLGYLRLIKSGFKTKNDSPESSEGYYDNLINVLQLLTNTQSSLIHKIKKEFIAEFNADLDSMISKMNAIKNLNPHQKQLSLFNACIKDLKKTVEDDISNPHVGFMDAMRSCFQISSSAMESVKELALLDESGTVSQYQDLFQRTFVHYLKKWTFWVDIEQTNQQCNSYATCGSFMDL